MIKKSDKYLHLVYDWKNNNVYNASPGFSLDFKGFQNGVEIEEFGSYAPEFKRNSGKTVRPGGWFKGVNKYFTFDSKIKEMVIEIGKIFNLDKEKPYILKINDIGKLK